MTEQVLSLLGLAKKAGRVEVGEEPVGAAARAKKARVILVAQDAGPSSPASGVLLCSNRGVPVPDASGR